MEIRYGIVLRARQMLLYPGALGKFLGCSSTTDGGNMGLDTLRSRKDKATLKRWYKLVSMPDDR